MKIVLYQILRIVINMCLGKNRDKNIFSRNYALKEAMGK